jgi:hypothetical protein
MSKKLLNQLFSDLFKEKELSTDSIICWYPSAGDNLDAFKYWSLGIGNSNIPKTFILTDEHYKFNDGTRDYFQMNENDNIDQIPDTYIINNYQSNMIIKNEEFFTQMQQWKEKLIEDIINEYNVIEFLNQEIEIKVFRLLNNPEFKSRPILSILNVEFEITLDYLFERLDLWVLANLNTLILDPQVLKSLSNPLNLDEIYAHLRKGYPTREIMMGTVLECDGSILILLKCRNEDFYNYCYNNNIEINCWMLHRHMDNFIYDNESTIINHLKIKECLGNTAYIYHNRENLIESNFIWESLYNNPIGNHNQNIAYVNYL